MIGNLLTLVSAAGAFVLGSLVVLSLLARRVRVLAEVTRVRRPNPDLS